MILRRLLLDPAEGEVAAAPAVAAPAPKPSTPSTPQASNAPKAPRALSEKEKGLTFKLDVNDPIFDKTTKSADLKEDVKKVEPTTTPVKPAATPETDEGKPVKPKAPDFKPVTETPAAAPVVQKHEHEPIVPKTTEKKEYDYTGFNDQEVTVLKNMSVQSRDYVTKMLKEKKELEKHKDGQFLQHPDAYTLDPQYSKLQEDVYYYNKETEYWQEQLAKVKSGDKWQPIKGWTKDGKPVAGEDSEPSAIAEEQIRLMMNRCYNATEAKQGELKQFTTNFKTRINTDAKAIQDERARRFGWVSNPKILESPVEIEPGMVKSVKEIREDLVSLFPPYMRNTQGVEVAADLFAALQIYGQEIRELKAGKQVAEVRAEEVTRAEPTSRNTPVNDNKGRINGVKEFSLSGLPI